MNLTTVIWNESNLCIAIEDFVYSVCFEQMNDQKFKQSLSTLYEAFQYFYSAQLHYSQSIQYFIQCKQWIDYFLNGQSASQILDFDIQQVSTLWCVLSQYKNDYWNELSRFIQQENQNRIQLHLTWLKFYVTFVTKIIQINIKSILPFLQIYQLVIGMLSTKRSLG